MTSARPACHGSERPPLVLSLQLVSEGRDGGRPGDPMTSSTRREAAGSRGTEIGTPWAATYGPGVADTGPESGSLSPSPSFLAGAPSPLESLAREPSLSHQAIRYPDFRKAKSPTPNDDRVCCISVPLELRPPSHGDMGLASHAVYLAGKCFRGL